jgi:glycosyltransferase involved in cell wall biosynthesis
LEIELAKPRFLIIVRGEENYGVQTQLLGLAAELVRRGWAISVYAIGDGEFAEKARRLPAEITIDPARPPRFLAEDGGRIRSYARVVANSAGLVRRLHRFLKENRFDAAVVREHGIILPVAAAASGTKARICWLMPNCVGDGYPLDLNRRLYEAVFRRGHIVPVGNSAFTLATLGRGAKYGTHIDLGIDPAKLAKFDPSAAPLLADLPAGSIKLLIMARLVEDKGQQMMLRAMLSDPAFAEMHLVLCGGPLGTPYAEALRAEADAAGAGDRLHLCGPVENVADYYNAVDVVGSVRIDAEPFGLSVVESMLAAKPVLTHALGGPAKVVVDGVTGWHITKPTVEGFAEGLRKMLADRERWPAIGKAGRQRALNHYTVETMTTQFLAAAGADSGDHSVHRPTCGAGREEPISPYPS